MKPLEAVLHAIALVGLVAVGAGVWSVSQREATPAPHPSASQADLQALSREIADLRRQVADLKDRPEPPRPLAALPPSPKAPESAPLAMVAALDDPKVQERIQAVVDARLEEEQKERQERQRDRGREFAQQSQEAFEEKAGLNATQKDLFGRLMTEARERLDEVRGKVRAKALTRDQGRDELKRYFAEADLKVQALMTAEQFKQYQAWSQPFRNMALNGRRSGRENPVP